MPAAADYNADPVMVRIAELVNTGARFFAENEMEPARLHFLAALALDPKQPVALQNLGAVLRTLKHYEAAEIVSKRSVKLTGGQNGYALCNLASAQMSLRKYHEAQVTCAAAIKLLPDHAPLYHNYALTCHMLGQFSKALAAFDKSLELEPNNNLVRSDRAICMLALGKLQEGLTAYEVRWDQFIKSRIWSLNIPEWQGEALEGRRILVHHEQGFGDGLMLVRFMKELAKKRCHITLAVPETLRELFKNSFPFIRVVDMKDEVAVSEDSGFDYHSPLLSVMRWLGIEKAEAIDSTPYLIAETKPAMRLPDTKIKIGICWASGDHSPMLSERRRLVPLPLFLPLMDNLDVSIISLQVGEDVKDIQKYGLESIVFDVSPKLASFNDTAQTIAALDLVISVDSAVAHLAGALGKRCILLSPYTRCWRWWSKISGWPWYSRMALFHQDMGGTWDRAMKSAIEKALWVVRDIG